MVDLGNRDLGESVVAGGGMANVSEDVAIVTVRLIRTAGSER